MTSLPKSESCATLLRKGSFRNWSPGLGSRDLQHLSVHRKLLIEVMGFHWLSLRDMPSCGGTTCQLGILLRRNSSCDGSKVHLYKQGGIRSTRFLVPHGIVRQKTCPQDDDVVEYRPSHLSYAVQQVAVILGETALMCTRKC